MKANLFARTIELTKAEAKAAGKIGSAKCKELHEYMAMYPGFEMQITAPSKRTVEFRGLDYKYMRSYIKQHDDENGTIMTEFRALIAQDKKDKVENAQHLKAQGYFDVKNWFLAKFPEIMQYKEAHDKRVQDILRAA